MMRSARSRHEEEEYEDEELVPRTGDGSFQKVELEELNVGRMANPLRSKHSETEQRRRSKINERFQILRDLIPQNDQKRDKASFLLEVIQYIQFLQAKLDMYEGSYQGWSQEPTKLMPWSKQRNSTGPLETFTDQPQLMRNGSGQEDNIVVTPSMHTNAHNSEDSGFREVTADKALNHTTVVTNRAIPVCISAQAILLGDVAGQPNLASLPDPGFQASLSQSQFWQSRSCAIASALPSYTLNEEELKVESDEASISNTYSQGLLNNLIQALQSSGVDLTQASISVQLDVGKQVNTGLSATSLSAKDHQNQCPDGQISTAYGVGSSCLHSDIPNKRPRT